MTPTPGDRLQRFVGDQVRFVLKARDGRQPASGWTARLRTNLGRAEMVRREIIQARTGGIPFAGASWRDLPMQLEADGWSLELPLAETGYFQAKAFLLDPRGWQHWPDGSDVGISVHPDAYRTANTLYCAFPRMFGASRTAVSTQDEKLENQLRQLDARGFTVIPPSGTLRDLIQCLPHIIETLGCRILHLLPVNPTPTTYARFGRFGSPYAALDLTGIDPALVVFDQRATGADQFRELTCAAHRRGGRVFLDIVINHTGWGAALQENHPEYYLKHPDGRFASPGAWGVTWEDLVELKHDGVALWDDLTDMFLTWCRRGVDGFRCDAGYKVPVAAWQYIIARVQQEFPETIFLLEGLGGAWETTEALLTEGGMQWAYSELFQNYSGREVAAYLDYSLRQSERVGLYVHYSETHDNDRLPVQRAGEGTPAERAARGRAWSLLRNRLCALASVSGGFGFTCGVEWLAAEKVRVHGSSGMSWDAKTNLVPELARLNRLLGEHPGFFDGAKLTRLSAPDSPVYALFRESAEGLDRLLVLVNTDLDQPGSLVLAADLKFQISDFKFDLLGQPVPPIEPAGSGRGRILLQPGAAHCLSPTAQPVGLGGEAYRRARARAAWAIQAIGESLPVRHTGPCDWQVLADMVDRAPVQFLAAVRHLDPELARSDLRAALEKAASSDPYPNVVPWSLVDRRRITPVPPGHWLLIEDTVPFRATLAAQPGRKGESATWHIQSIRAGSSHLARFAPRLEAAEATLSLERYTDQDPRVEAAVRFLAAEPSPAFTHPAPRATDVVLLTNGIGGMARIGVDLGRVQSKYDCVLAANLHPSLPVDRHVLAKRIRVWVNADGFLSALNSSNLHSFAPGPPAVWHFVANAGDGRTVEIVLRADMVEGRNTTVFQFSRPGGEAPGMQLPAGADVRLTARVDIEDRNFHWETKRNGGADHHFASNTRPLGAREANLQPPLPRQSAAEAGTSNIQPPIGFAFTPAADRQLRVFTDAGEYHPQPEWSENLQHPVEQSRGQTGSGDAFSPGWFDLPLSRGGEVNLAVTAELDAPKTSSPKLQTPSSKPTESSPDRAAGAFEQLLLRAASAFVVRRGEGRTVIAGYPWFLDWGRDTFICARGLLAAGLIEEVRQILLVFARFEKDGTLPNTIHGDDASNRDTSDAPLWFGVVCEELATHPPTLRFGAASHASRITPTGDFYSTPIGNSKRTLRDVLTSIATHYASGTPNGIRMDPASALIWSPSHFTWMDTNYPAATPREGYPVEIQALWIRLLRQLAALSEPAERERWSRLAEQALASLERWFWLEDRGYFADLLIARPGQPAAEATASDALRSNCLFPVSLGLVQGAHARRCVAAAARHLLVPGALRSLAPLPVSVPLPVYGHDGRLLNHPAEPYQGSYEGNEDTQRKPAYHNGTAWTWTLPVFCEALARAWDLAPEAVAAARAHLGGLDRLLAEGCLGQLPEILDGDAPHRQRGCDAQAWSVTEALRVWRWLAKTPN